MMNVPHRFWSMIQSMLVARASFERLLPDEAKLELGLF
jgi:hypothetical protein